MASHEVVWALGTENPKMSSNTGFYHRWAANTLFGHPVSLMWR